MILTFLLEDLFKLVAENSDTSGLRGVAAISVSGDSGTEIISFNIPSIFATLLLLTGFLIKSLPFCYLKNKVKLNQINRLIKFINE